MIAPESSFSDENQMSEKSKNEPTVKNQDEEHLKKEFI
jgi:hypothetical protein